ncbi:right-handed parallel beta-helix repeat-containing protein [Ruficoccus amylovorans]|uniref:Right-handed parallel beta-helix repeat-containing protein n=1 Tax=Ruficoccus amylovorans TaxID=1804625 RepID=A0A842HHC0_9BACT|nr:right-handed parallel beta-helix repeat-containing protein [Ruficoccus amylovorans]MBC2595570.1 right-handed parallel beta-helix repeat-containing protein [Ruficoccus amylovorans]
MPKKSSVRFLKFPLSLSVLLAAAAFGIGCAGQAQPASVTVLSVDDYGAVPNDGADDSAAIAAALKASSEVAGPVRLVFSEGTYNFRPASTPAEMVRIEDRRDLIVSGQVAEDGAPATRLEINLELVNDTLGAGHFVIENSENIMVENLVLDYNPRFASAGKVVAVDREQDTVEVDIFPGMPHFDGMRCYSANSWDLETGDLLQVEALTIGLDRKRMANTWHPVEGAGGVRYRIEGIGFSDRVAVGDGISWHFTVNGSERNFLILYSENITLRNIDIFNTLGAAMLAGYNKDIVMEDVRVIPEGNSLAVGPRDAFHLSNNRGRLLMDGVQVKGVRWDPIVSRGTFNEIVEIEDDGAIIVEVPWPRMTFESGNTLLFQVGEVPYERVVASAESLGDKRYRIRLSDPALPEVSVGDFVANTSYEFDDVVIRNCTVEGNYGTGIVFMTQNALIENNLFRNNAYSDIGLGPTSQDAGPFARHVIIRGNTFDGSNWVRKHSGASGHDGSITVFSNQKKLMDVPYNQDILIEDNVFKNLDHREGLAAVNVKNASDVVLRGNSYENVSQHLKVGEHTVDVTDED